MENNQPACCEDDFQFKCKCSSCDKINLQIKKNLIYSFEMPRLMAMTDEAEERALFQKLWKFLYDIDITDKDYEDFKKEKSIINSK